MPLASPETGLRQAVANATVQLKALRRATVGQAAGLFAFGADRKTSPRLAINRG